MKKYFIDMTKSSKRYETEGTYDAEGMYNYDETWEENHYFTVNGVYANGSDNDCVSSTVPIENGATAYLLLIGTGHGDGSGLARNSNVEGVHLFENKNLALLAMNKIKKESIDGVGNFLIIKSDAMDIEVETRVLHESYGGLDTMHLYKVVVGEPVVSIVEDITYMNIAMVEYNIQKLGQTIYIEAEQKLLDNELVATTKEKVIKL